MKAALDPTPISESDADLICVGLHDEADLPGWLAEAPGAGDVHSGPGKLTMVRPDGRRVLVVGLGDEDDFEAEDARGVAALAVRQARRYSAERVAWEIPGGGAATAAAITGATTMASYSFDRLKSSAVDDDDPPAAIGELRLHGVSDGRAATEIVEVARVAALAANRARDLQNLPANIADPAYLAERAGEIAAGQKGVELELLGPDELERLGMGGLISVGAGSQKDPVQIVLRYSGAPESDEKTAIVGKAVTFDTGGISLKPSASMQEMKMDMSGGAAALEATAAIAELGLALNIVCVVPAVENMPGGRATRPGDVITQLNGKTVEVNNTDAEGRLILADALTWAERDGCGRIVDLATLTGAVVVSLGSSYAAVVSNDDRLAERIEGAGGRTGELVWRMPQHPEYLELMKGTIADLSNAAPKRKAGALTAAAFLGEFVEEAGWAHIDIAGTAWDVGRPYVGKGPSGYGVRLLVELARELST